MRSNIFLPLIQDSFLTQHVLNQPGERMYYISSSQNELVDNVRMHQPLRNRDHHQIQFDIKVKLETTNKTYRKKVHKGIYKDMRKYLEKLDWNSMLRNKTSIECWNIIKCVAESIIYQFVPQNKENGLERNYVECV